MTITVGSFTFDDYKYDERGDVLYLSIGPPQEPAKTHATPEGHAVDYDDRGTLVGMVLYGPRFYLGRDGHVKVTFPRGEPDAEVGSNALAPVLAA